MNHQTDQENNRMTEPTAERAGNEGQTQNQMHSQGQEAPVQSQEILTKTDVQAMISETVLKFKNEILELFHSNKTGSNQEEIPKKRSL